MPNEDYNANFEALMLLNLTKIYESTGQQMSKSDFIGLDSTPYMHAEELVRDLEELHFIETEYDDEVYFLTEQGYTYLEQRKVTANTQASGQVETKKPRSRILDIVLIGAGLLALMYAASLYLNLKEAKAMENQKQEIKP